jgi:hypothetical protein
MAAMGNMIHRTLRYATDYPGFKGGDLTPKSYISGDSCPRFFNYFNEMVE